MLHDSDLKNGDIALRPASLQDADFLLECRNDPNVRLASHHTAKISREDHLVWLEEAIDSPDQRLFVAEENGVPVGTVRADYSNGEFVLSWSVVPRARGHGVAKRMVALLASTIAAPIRAEVKASNKASASIAECAGMEFVEESNGVLHYRREAKK